MIVSCHRLNLLFKKAGVYCLKSMLNVGHHDHARSLQFISLETLVDLHADDAGAA